MKKKKKKKKKKKTKQNKEQKASVIELTVNCLISKKQGRLNHK